MPRAAAAFWAGVSLSSTSKAAAITAMKAEVEPTASPTKGSRTRRTPFARQFSSTSFGSAWWSATKK